GTDRGRVAGGRGGARDKQQHDGGWEGRGVVSAQGGVAPEPGKPYRGGGSRLPASPRRGASSAGEVAGTARRHEPEPPVAAPEQACRSLCIASADLWLVHRGF